MKKMLFGWVVGLAMMLPTSALMAQQPDRDGLPGSPG